MYFGYQKDTLTGKTVPFKSPEIPTGLNDKPVPVIMLVNLTEEEMYLEIPVLVERYPAP